MVKYGNIIVILIPLPNTDKFFLIGSCKRKLKPR